MNPAPRWAPTVLTRAPLMNTINPPSSLPPSITRALPRLWGLCWLPSLARLFI
ncbi:hypothetical protein B0H14DRAFT_3449061 [Mycena olivaceomarginata]|nr:hypothetical protein B0H14DRAFT_3449061 [Mycena olivaceomarginata]